MPRIERDRTPEGMHRFVQAAARLEDDAEVAVPVGHGGRERKAVLDERERLVLAALLMREHTGVVHGIRVIGNLLEDGAIDVFGRGQVPVLLAPDRDRHRVIDGQVLPRGLKPPRYILRIR